MEPVGLPDIEIAPPPPAVPAKAPRLTSLDAFRGLTIAAMILVNNLGDPKYAPLEHAEWNGWTFTDLIFPFFLFIVGVAMPFSFARRSVTTEQTRGQLLGRVWLRALSLWMLGQLLFAFPMPMTGDALARGEVKAANPEYWLISDGKLYLFGKSVGPELFGKDLAGNVQRANQNRVLLSSH